MLKKCEWGHDDYSLEIQNLPTKSPEEEMDPSNASILPARAGGTPALHGTSGPRIKAQRRATVREPNIFDAGEAAG